jgi:cysteine desulfurase/selenocysteine lyase
VSLDQDVAELFPQLKRQVRGRRLVYLDSAATALKPVTVIEAVRQSLMIETANVHRGAHLLSDEATEKFENVREKVREFLGAESRGEIIFTRGTTDGINLVAQSLGGLILDEGDEILVSQMEHHSNIVPWQMIAAKTRAQVRFTPVLDDGSLDFAAFKAMLSKRTKIVSLVHLSNALGTVNPLAEFFKAAHEVGAVCVADVAQSVSAMPVKVAELGADFAAFSGHKIFAPTGIGVLYGKKQWLDQMPPYQGGGSMISEVTESGSTYLQAPHRFEAGTPPIAQVIGLGAALDFVRDLGFDNIKAHEREIMSAADAAISEIGGIRRIGTAPGHSHAFSFLLEGHHPSDVGAILDEQGIAVRAGHHCCQPLMRRFGIAGTARASFSVYTSTVDIADFISGVKKAKELLT